MDEIKALVAEIQGLTKELREGFEEEKKRNTELSAEWKAKEEAITKRLEELELKVQRAAFVGAASGVQQTVEDDKTRAHKAAFFAWIRKGKSELSPEERKALVEDATGEILVPEVLESEIYRELPKLTVVRNLATVRTITTGNRIRRRSLTEVAVGWGKLETGAPLTESTLVPGEAFQYVEDAYGLTKVGEDELADTDIALEPIITDSFTRAFAEQEDTAFIIGTGHLNQQPEGILDGNVVTRVDAGQVGAITLDDLINLAYAVPEQYERNGVYIVRTSTVQKMRLMKDSNGQFLWQPTLAAGEPPTFNGHPVYRQNDIPAIPAAGTAADVAIFGDIRAGYRIVDRLGMTMQRLNELYATSGLIGFKAHRRVGGGVIRPNAIRILRVPAA